MRHENFFATDPCPRASWRLAVLMGENTRTYKFALGQALLEHAMRGDSEVALPDLAATYARGVVAHAAHAPQASEKSTGGERDFLTIAAREAEESARLGHPTDLLVDAAVRSMPQMVMQKFHNLRGAAVPHRFYELTGSRRERVVQLTPHLLDVAASEQAAGLRLELEARWNIVENSFATGIGRSLVHDGVTVDWQSHQLTDKLRRKPVTGVREALVPFQHGRCLICWHVIGVDDAVAIDHVFPLAFMKRYGSVLGWRGPDLDSVWNLAPAHAACNLSKSAKVPCDELLGRLALRNEAIMGSPHPLRTTLHGTLTAAGLQPSSDWWEFIREVKKACA
ncbi:HNH endonuclease [Streptomyces monticola]|uniref:HNH endonuclease n=1 Tax=Streptomyces monticola TaxID=2666263 RepID=A0ABW2JB55_9ACTN